MCVKMLSSVRLSRLKAPWASPKIPWFIRYIFIEIYISKSCNRSLYSNVSNKVLFGDFESDWFDQEFGLKHGCVLSPTLFSVLMNDLVSMLYSLLIEAWSTVFLSPMVSNVITSIQNVYVGNKTNTGNAIYIIVIHVYIQSN
jgi:hypothetical protein